MIGAWVATFATTRIRLAIVGSLLTGRRLRMDEVEPLESDDILEPDVALLAMGKGRKASRQLFLVKDALIPCKVTNKIGKDSSTVIELKTKIYTHSTRYLIRR